MPDWKTISCQAHKFLSKQSTAQDDSMWVMSLFPPHSDRKMQRYDVSGIIEPDSQNSTWVYPLILILVKSYTPERERFTKAWAVSRILGVFSVKPLHPTAFPSRSQAETREEVTSCPRAAVLPFLWQTPEGLQWPSWQGQCFALTTNHLTLLKEAQKIKKEVGGQKGGKCFQEGNTWLGGQEGKGEVAETTQYSSSLEDIHGYGRDAHGTDALHACTSIS